MGRMIGKLSEERTCYVSIALLEIVSELTKCPPTIDEGSDHQSDLSADGLGSVRKTPSIRS